MKRIVKNLPNKPLEKWRAKQVPQHLAFKNLSDPDREEVLEWLLKEQGYLCCYTGIKITTGLSHIEHLKPQTICRDEGTLEEIAAENVLAAYPKDSPKDRPIPFGAMFRGSWYGEDKKRTRSDLFVHPLMPDCEARFHYKWTGEVVAKQTGDIAAETTIKKLGLDCEDLSERRRAVVQQIFFKKSRTLSEQEIERMLSNIDKPDKDGAFRAFAFVLKQAGHQLLAAGKKQHARRVAIQRSKRK